MALSMHCHYETSMRASHRISVNEQRNREFKICESKAVQITFVNRGINWCCRVWGYAICWWSSGISSLYIGLSVLEIEQYAACLYRNYSFDFLFSFGRSILFFISNLHTPHEHNKNNMKTLSVPKHIREILTG